MPIHQQAPMGKSHEQELSPSRIRRNGGARGLDAARRALLGTMLCSVIQDSAGVRESSGDTEASEYDYYYYRVTETARSVVESVPWNALQVAVTLVVILMSVVYYVYRLSRKTHQDHREADARQFADDWM